MLCLLYFFPLKMCFNTFHGVVFMKTHRRSTSGLHTKTNRLFLGIWFAFALWVLWITNSSMNPCLDCFLESLEPSVCSTSSGRWIYFVYFTLGSTFFPNLFIFSLFFFWILNVFLSCFIVVVFVLYFRCFLEPY